MIGKRNLSNIGGHNTDFLFETKRLKVEEKYISKDDYDRCEAKKKKKKTIEDEEDLHEEVIDDGLQTKKIKIIEENIHDGTFSKSGQIQTDDGDSQGFLINKVENKWVEQKASPPSSPPPLEFGKYEFDRGTIDVIKEILREEEENKLVIASLSYKDEDDSLNLIDASAKHGLHISSIFNQDMKASDFLLAKVHLYGFCVWDSKIYFAGGHLKDDPSKILNSFHCFNFNSKTWDINPKLPTMKLPRNRPMLIAAHNKIFAFPQSQANVSLMPCRCSIPMEDLLYRYNPEAELQLKKDKFNQLVINGDWAEFYDIPTSRWISLLPPPPLDLWAITGHVVHERQNQILFWVEHKGIFSFNYNTATWNALRLLNLIITIPDIPPWSGSVAVVGDVVFWDFCGRIYAHDLNNGRTSLICTVDDSGYNVLQPWLVNSPPLSHLVSIGRSRLCLFSWRNTRSIVHHMLKIKVNGETDLELSCERVGFNPTNSISIEAAIQL